MGTRISPQGSHLLSWGFQRAAEAAFERKPRADDLYSLVGRLCQNANDHAEICEATLQSVRTAVAIIRNPERIEKLEAALGYKPPQHHHIALAMTVAALDLDRVNGASRADLQSGRSSKAMKGNKVNTQEHPKPFDRAASIIAALLQEFVAQGALTLEEVGQKFGKDSDSYKLTRETSRITRMPISLRQPDKEGRLSLVEIDFNKTQAILAQDLILLTENPVRVGMIKIADALQQLRDLNDNRPLENAEGVPDIHVRTALHIKDMYLPLVRIMGMRDILKEMKNHILNALDPQAAREIEKQRENIASPMHIRAALKKIRNGLRKAGFGMKSIKAVMGGSKEVYSIWIKPFDKLLEAARKRGNEREIIGYTKAQRVDLTSIYDVLRFRIILKDSYTPDGQIDSRANKERIRNLHKVFSGIYTPVEGRMKDYLGNNKKPNGYEALQDTFDIGGFAMELHFVTESMEAINECNHGVYKQKNCKETGDHPSSFFPGGRQSRDALLKDTMDRLAARITNDPLPEHATRDLIIVSFRDGVLVSPRIGETLRELITYYFSHNGEFCDESGEPIVWKADETAENRLNRVMETIQRQRPCALDKPLNHAATVPFIRFLPSQVSQVVPVRPSPPLSSAQTASLEYAIP
jgi:hypothetical protein